MITSICPQCEQPFCFYPSQPKTYCSVKCKSDASRIWTNCPECDKHFWYYRSWPRIYCSRKCSAANAIKNLGIHGQGIRVEVTCDECGKVFTRNEFEVNKTKLHFCNTSCFGQYLSRTRKGIPRPEARGERPNFQKRVTKTCPQCNKVFQVKVSHSERRKYCSRKCMDSAGQAHCICQFCFTSFIGKKSISDKGGNRFCSRGCYAEYSKTLTGPLSNNWRGGYEPYYGPNWIEQRNKTRKRDNYICQDCGITEIELGQELDVHHKEPFRKFGLDNYLQANYLDNLIAYCRQCHVRHEPRL